MRMPFARSGAVLLFTLMLVVVACSGGAAKPTVSDAWVRVPMGADRPAAGYMTIVGGDAADVLIAAAVDDELLDRAAHGEARPERLRAPAMGKWEGTEY